MSSVSTCHDGGICRSNMPFMDVLLHGCDSSNSTNSVRKLHGMGMGPDCRRGADKGNGPSAEDMFNIKEGSAIAEKEKLASEAALCRTQVALLEDAVSRQQETLRRAARLPTQPGHTVTFRTFVSLHKRS
eukprot:evm.model.scf_56EXC.8 EVM.evm.TU.scf_56EXC.8   scf_56EXC:91154-91543(-)